MRRNWKIWVGYGVSAVALGLTLRSVKLADLGAALAGARLVWLLPTIGLMLVNLLLRAWRWSLLMGKSPFWVTFHANNIGYMLNVTLPLRLGELGRAFVIGQRTAVSMSRAMSAIILERILDLSSVVLLLVIFAQFVPVPPLFARAATVGAVLVVVIIAFGAALVWQAKRAEGLLRSLLSRVSEPFADRWTKRFVELCQGFRAVGSARRLGLVILITVVTWASSVVLTYVMMPTFLEPNVGQAGLVLVAANFGGALPSAPGGVGVMQGFAQTALVVPFHLPEDKALAFVLVYTFGQQLVLLALGALGLARIGMSFAEVRTKNAPARTATTEET